MEQDGVHSTDNLFLEYPAYNPFTLWWFDWFHICIIGLIKHHLMEWLKYYLDTYRFRKDWKAFLLRIPPFPELHVLEKEYSSIKQWTGKQLRQLVRYLLCSLAPILKPTTQGSQPAEHLKVLRATRNLLEIIILSQQRYHTSASLEAIDANVNSFHELKDVFLPARTPSHFNFPKLYLLMHLTNHIRLHGACNSWTTNISEGLHMDFKDA